MQNSGKGVKTLLQMLFYLKKSPGKLKKKKTLSNYFMHLLHLISSQGNSCFPHNVVTVSLTFWKLFISCFKTVLTFSYLRLGAESSMAW